MLPALTHAGLSHRGCVREENEDNWCAHPELGLYIVSDGLGGECAGALASRVVVDALPEMLRARARALSELSGERAVRVVKEVLVELSAQVSAQTHGEAGLEGMGATVVLALVRGQKALIAHMGDSRAYLFRHGRLRLLTKDHSVVQLLVEAGEISKSEADRHPARGQVTRSVGMEGEPLPEARVVAFRAGDRLLLCTDGLTGMLSDEGIERSLAQETQPQAACRALVESALSNGGKDNVTAVVVDMPSGPNQLQGQSHRQGSGRRENPEQVCSRWSPQAARSGRFH